MNSVALHALLVAAPLGTFLLFWALFYSRKGNHPATYTMSERWTHEPILWAATDESVPGGVHRHGNPELSVGGGASGRW